MTLRENTWENTMLKKFGSVECEHPVNLDVLYLPKTVLPPLTSTYFPFLQHFYTSNASQFDSCSRNRNLLRVPQGKHAVILCAAPPTSFSILYSCNAFLIALDVLQKLRNSRSGISFLFIHELGCLRLAKWSLFTQGASIFAFREFIQKHHCHVHDIPYLLLPLPISCSYCMQYPHLYVFIWGIVFPYTVIISALCPVWTAWTFLWCNKTLGLICYCGLCWPIIVEVLKNSPPVRSWISLKISASQER